MRHFTLRTFPSTTEHFSPFDSGIFLFHRHLQLRKQLRIFTEFPFKLSQASLSCNTYSFKYDSSIKISDKLNFSANI